MKKYFKPIVSVISVLGAYDIASSLQGLDAFTSLENDNIESYDTTSADLAGFIK